MADIRFSYLCEMFKQMQRSKTPQRKRKLIQTFFDFYRRKNGNVFGAMRLMLPSLDRERGSYGLKETTLATGLVDALGISRESEDALRLVNWRKGGAKTGMNAGNFALVAFEVLQRRQGSASGGLTINELNDSLDLLAAKENRAEKTSVLADLIKKTNALEMKWILMIILKDLKVGMTEKSIFHEFHSDAEDLFNVTCDLKLVCEKLKDPKERHKRQDIEVGKAVRPQLAVRVSDATTAWKKFHGKQVVVECKFDGDRIQIHKNGTDIHFFSRNFLEHPEYGHAMSSVIMQNVLMDRCILDGEMLVWDTSANRFAEFGSNQEIAKAAKDGLESDRQLCYVAFDILYAGDTSVIHQSLSERHELLKRSVNTFKGRLEILIPNGGLNARRASGDPCWSIIAYNVEDVEHFFKETVENRDEGIVLKDLGSKWDPGDRSGKWLKLKPEYVSAGTDLDVLIIGGYYGSGRHGGEVAQFLVGLADCSSTSSTYPRRFISFCRVGSGLSDGELDTLITKLKPYFRKNEYPKKVPVFYEVTNNSKERPDVWIDNPEKSIILSITSDVRTIKSEVFAAPYSLRFPRIHRVRYDKPWHECLDVQSFVDLVLSSNGSTQQRHTFEQKPKGVQFSKKREKKKVFIVPNQFLQTDVSGVKEETLIFTNKMFYFVNIPSSHSLDLFHKMVVENGGSFSMNLNDAVTHCIAAEKKGIKYEAAKLHGDVIHYSWILDCCSTKCLLPLQPKYFLFVNFSKKLSRQDMDKYSDYYYLDIDVTDIKQIFSNMEGVEYIKTIDYYRKKFCPVKKWCLFQDMRIYFYFFEHMDIISHYEDLSEIMLRRLKLEISMSGGEICNDISLATHMVLFSVMESDLDFDTIFRSFPVDQRNLLCNKRLHVVGLHWLERSLEDGYRLSEEKYTLRPKNRELQEVEESDCCPGLSGTSYIVEEQKSSPNKGAKYKKKRLPSTKMEENNVNNGRRTRARRGSHPAKLRSNEEDQKLSLFEEASKKDVEFQKDYFDTRGSMEEKKNEDYFDTHGLKEETNNMKDVQHLQGFMDTDSIKHDKSDGEDYHKMQFINTTASKGEEEKSRTNQKLEITIDPVQAMLLDMIPSLSRKELPASQPNTVYDRPEPSLASNQGKKKVSYKDVAGELLKDW